MNSVESHHSSLMSKENDVAIFFPEAFDPPAPPTKAMAQELTFRPRNGNQPLKAPYPGPAEALLPEPAEPYTPSQMETGIFEGTTNVDAACAESHEPVSRVQQNAMDNSQYRSASILNPPVTPAAVVTQENQHDQSGNDGRPENQLPSRPSTEIVEGWDVASVPLEDSQKYLGTDPLIVRQGPGEEDLAEERKAFDEKEQKIINQVNKKLEQLASDQGIAPPANPANTPAVYEEAHQDYVDQVIHTAETVTGEPYDITVAPADAGLAPVAALGN